MADIKTDPKTEVKTDPFVGWTADELRAHPALRIVDAKLRNKMSLVQLKAALASKEVSAAAAAAKTATDAAKAALNKTVASV